MHRKELQWFCHRSYRGALAQPVGARWARLLGWLLQAVMISSEPEKVDRKEKYKAGTTRGENLIKYIFIANRHIIKHPIWPIRLPSISMSNRCHPTQHALPLRMRRYSFPCSMMASASEAARRGRWRQRCETRRRLVTADFGAYPAVQVVACPLISAA